MLDEPGLVIDAIREVVETARHKAGEADEVVLRSCVEPRGRFGWAHLTARGSQRAGADITERGRTVGV